MICTALFGSNVRFNHDGEKGGTHTQTHTPSSRIPCTKLHVHTDGCVQLLHVSTQSIQRGASCLPVCFAWVHLRWWSANKNHGNVRLICVCGVCVCVCVCVFTFVKIRSPLKACSSLCLSRPLDLSTSRPLDLCEYEPAKQTRRDQGACRGCATSGQQWPGRGCGCHS